MSIFWSYDVWESIDAVFLKCDKVDLIMSKVVSGYLWEYNLHFSFKYILNDNSEYFFFKNLYPNI